MKNIFDCYGIFSPKRGIKKYMTLPVYIMLAAQALLTAAALSDGTRAMPISCAAIFAVPALTAAAETVFAAFTMMGMAAEDSRKLLFLRTVPDMESIVKNAYAADCVKNILLCLITCALSEAIAAVCGYYEMSTVVCACVFAAAMMYITISVGVYIVRRVKKGSVQILLILEYIWFTAAVLISVLGGICILTGNGVRIFMISALITAAAAGHICHTSAVKRTVGCRYPDNAKEV